MNMIIKVFCSIPVGWDLELLGRQVKNVSFYYKQIFNASVYHTLLNLIHTSPMMKSHISLPKISQGYQGSYFVDREDIRILGWYGTG